MARSSGTKWDLDRDLGTSEDEFFGLLEEDELPGEEPAAPGVEPKTPLLQKIIHALVLRGDDESEEVETIEDVIVEQAPEPRRPGVTEGDLEEYIIRLPAGREWDDFLQAEQEATLFDSVQETKKKRIRSSAWALWITAALWAFLGVKYGQAYLTALTDPTITGGAFLTEQLGAKAAQGVTVTSGILAPVAGFLLSASSIALLIGGIYERRPMRGILGVCGLIALGLLVSLLGESYYVAALITGLLAWVILRAVEWILLRLGAY